MLLGLALAAALSVPACDAQIAAAKPAIEQANGDWLRALKAGDAAAIAAAYADDGVFVLPDGSQLAGRAAVEKLYARPTPGIVVGGIDSEGVACGADGLIYEWGQGRLVTRDADGREQTRGGPYLTVWKRIGGDWKIVRNLAF